MGREITTSSPALIPMAASSMTPTAIASGKVFRHRATGRALYIKVFSPDAAAIRYSQRGPGAVSRWMRRDNCDVSTTATSTPANQARAKAQPCQAKAQAREIRLMGRMVRRSRRRASRIRVQVRSAMAERRGASATSPALASRESISLTSQRS